MEIVEAKTKVSIAYTLKEMSGRILEEIPPSHPFVYIHGYDNIIPGLENALEGRKLGESFSVEIPFNQGYGPYRDDLLLQVPKEELQEIGELGLNLDDEDDADGIYIVKEIYKDTVLVDGNHPFAGKDLIFDVQVINIEEPSFTELETGFPDRDENFDEGSDYPDSYDDHYDGFDDPDNRSRRWR